MLDIPIVDSHVHFWDLERLTYPWLSEFPSINQSLLPKNLSIESKPYDISKIVFVECGGEKTGQFTETQLITKLAEQDSRIKAIIAHAPLENGLKVEATLTEFKKNPLIRGIRRLIQSEKDLAFCLRTEFISGVKILSQFGYTFDLCIYHNQLSSVISLVRQCPEVKFVLDHIGKPSIKTNTLDPWRENLKELSKEHNVYCKLSGLATEADWKQWDIDQLRPYVEHTIDCFGYNRLMFGGDWPVAKLAISYPQWVTVLDTLTKQATHEERLNLFSNTAELFYRI
jgi:L-fuconolactonase